MTSKTPVPHLIETTDPHRPDPHTPRSCERCGLPETRVDIHPTSLPETPAEVEAFEARLLGEPTEH